MQAQKSVRLPFKAAHGAPRSVVLRAPRHQTSSTRGATLVARAAEYRMPMWEYVQQKLVSEKVLACVHFAHADVLIGALALHCHSCRCTRRWHCRLAQTRGPATALSLGTAIVTGCRMLRAAVAAQRVCAVASLPCWHTAATIHQTACTCHRARAMASAFVSAHYATPDVTACSYITTCHVAAVVPQIESVSPQRAAEMAASGQWTIVDVRPAAEFQAAHIPGAASCPLYQPLDMSAADFGKMLKFVALKANGVNPVEPNPKFKETMAAIAASDKGLVVVCETGGTLQPSTSFANGALRPIAANTAAKGCFLVLLSHGERRQWRSAALLAGKQPRKRGPGALVQGRWPLGGNAVLPVLRHPPVAQRRLQRIYVLPAAVMLHEHAQHALAASSCNFVTRMAEWLTALCPRAPQARRPAACRPSTAPSRRASSPTAAAWCTLPAAFSAGTKHRCRLTAFTTPATPAKRPTLCEGLQQRLGVIERAQRGRGVVL